MRISLNAPNYLNNPQLKAAGVQMHFEPWQVKEIQRCATDWQYFIEKYVKFVHPDKGLINIKLYEFQKDLIDMMNDNRYIIAKVARQSGKSTCVIAYFLWIVLFQKFKDLAILADKAELSQELLGRIKTAYEDIPLWLQQGVIKWNERFIKLENGSSITAAATTSKAARGRPFFIIFLDEFAHVEPNMAADFFKSAFPTISSGKTTKCFIVSTPNGMNYFHSLWVRAEKGKSEFKTFETHWSSVPGRDQAWRDGMVANMGEDEFNQEFGTDFLGSSNTLISTSTLKFLADSEETPLTHKGKLSIYNNPVAGNKYFIAVDPAEGVGIDHSAFSVIDITQLPYRQVATFYDKDITDLFFPHAINEVGRFYNNADVLVELNNNGGVVAQILLHDLEYPNLITLSQASPNAVKSTRGLGVKMNKAVKAVGCSNLKDLLEKNQLEVVDSNTILELMGFIEKGKSYEAEPGFHDDLVMSLVIFGWFINHPYFEGMTDDDVRVAMYAERTKALEEDVMPFGFIVGMYGASDDDGWDWDSPTNPEGEDGVFNF